MFAQELFSVNCPLPKTRVLKRFRDVCDAMVRSEMSACRLLVIC